MTEVNVIDLTIARGDATEALEIDQALEASPLLSAEVKDIEGKPYCLLISMGDVLAWREAYRQPEAK